jgi:hypothetical protein
MRITKHDSRTVHENVIDVMLEINGKLLGRLVGDWMLFKRELFETKAYKRHIDANAKKDSNMCRDVTDQYNLPNISYI